MPSQSTSTFATTIGRNVKLARAEAGLTQRALAEKIDVDPMLVSKWERAWHRPSDENLQLLAEYTGRPLVWFYVDHDLKAAA